MSRTLPLSMTRARPLPALIAALASISATLPLLTLFSTPAWTRPSVLVVATVMLTGVLARAATVSTRIPVIAQSLTLLAMVHTVFLRELAWRLLPTRQSLQGAGALLEQALETVQRFSAPAPSTAGVVFAITLLTGVTALVVDHVGVTLHAPAAAGLPLLTAYLGSAANSGGGLPASWFVLPALLWLALLGEDRLRGLRHWGGVARSANGTGRDPLSGLAKQGRTLGAVILGAAVLLPATLPHLPPTILAEGLGRTGWGGAGVTLASTLDVQRSLQDRSDAVVLRYTTTDSSPPPLRVGVLTDYEEGQWQPSSAGRVDSGGLLPAIPHGLAGSASAEITVQQNHVRSPQLALPADLVRLGLGPEQWWVDESGILHSTIQVGSYHVRYLTPALTDEAFATTTGPGPDPSTMVVDPASAPAVAELLSTIVPHGASPLETARAIQAQLRGWTYSLQLASPQPVPGSPAGADPITVFLGSQRGYCVQYATAMVMMARWSGIPARMAIGFLPGSLSDGIWTVRASDAHTWPELWFPNLGWVRFEPTPSARTGGVPSWTVPSSVSGAPAAPTASPLPTPATAPTDRPETDHGAQQPTATGNPGSVLRQWVRTHRWELAGSAFILVGAMLLPVAARFGHLRERRRARTDAQRTEVEWQALLARLDDLGIPPPRGATPRATAVDLRERCLLTGTDVEALARVVTTVEQARYAAPDGRPLDVRSDARTVARAAASGRSRIQRIRAALVPSQGVRHLRTLGTTVADGVRSLVSGRVRRR